jgi:hypothetical protein
MRAWRAPIIEVAPGLMIERVIDLALKAGPDLEPGILFVERQFGILVIHGPDKDKLLAAGRVHMSGRTADVERGLAEIERVLAGIGGRES